MSTRARIEVVDNPDVGFAFLEGEDEMSGVWTHRDIGAFEALARGPENGCGCAAVDRHGDDGPRLAVYYIHPRSVRRPTQRPCVQIRGVDGFDHEAVLPLVRLCRDCLTAASR